MQYKAEELIVDINRWKRIIRKFPSIRYLGSSELCKKCKPVTSFDATTKRKTNKLKKIFTEFRKETGLGRGMAAPQIGIIERFVVVVIEDKNIILVNPKIIKRSKELTICNELCMSFGNLSATVVRPKYITIEYQDENGKKNVLEADMSMSRILQHELDHLDGILYTEKAIRNGLTFVYNMKQFKRIEDVEPLNNCPCGSKINFKNCCGKN